MANIVYMARSAWTGLLDTIRSKAGITGSMTVSQAADAVNSITGGDERFRGLIERTLSSISDSSVTEIGEYAFYGNKAITSVNFPNVSIVMTSAFHNADHLQYAYFDSVVKLSGSYTFNNCSSLQSVSMPILSSVGAYAFARCIALSYINFPSLRYMASGAFGNMTALETVDLPNMDAPIKSGAFTNCTSLKSINIPKATLVENDAFSACSSLSEVVLPKVKNIWSYAFCSCWSLGLASFDSLSSIASHAFQNCFNLLSLYLLGSSVAKLSTDAVFSSTPIGGYTDSTGGVYGSIFVPTSLYATYIATHPWSYYSSRFVSV